MSRIDSVFQNLKDRNEVALVAFLTAGDPDLESTLKLATEICSRGADILEIGIPFSDPLAEGVTIQKASERSLANGTTLEDILELTRKLGECVETPIVLMGYANPFFSFGEERFARFAGDVGVSGVIVPDLPPEEGKNFYNRCEASDIDPILLVAPTTSPERLKYLSAKTRGFLYYVSLTGVTGERAVLPSGLKNLVTRVRSQSLYPVCVGFGISTAKQASEVSAFADGVIVGSAFVDRVARSGNVEEAVRSVGSFASELKKSLVQRTI